MIMERCYCVINRLQNVVMVSMELIVSLALKTMSTLAVATGGLVKDNGVMCEIVCIEICIHIYTTVVSR